jgi:glycosyltransferase involved in cell wall biosynthesis
MHFHSESKEKIGLIVSEIATQWVSCIRINEGLKLAYEQASDIQIFQLYGVNSRKVISSIIESDIHCLVFLDHQVRPLEILRDMELLKVIAAKRMRIIIHVYGCFVDRLVEYYSILNLLKDQDVHFITASPKHKKLVEQSLTAPENAVHLIPFPVKAPIQGLRKSQADIRKALGLPLSGRMFLYTGRISTYKNVELAMKMFAKIHETNPDLFFVYVGLFDNFDTYTGNDKMSNQAIINANVLNQIDPKSTWCFYRGFVQEAELASYYLAADAFICLSVCRGEDFGMSALEASSYGLPCYLTDWGGYSGFANLANTHFAPVKIVEDDILISLEQIEIKVESFQPSTQKEKDQKAHDVQIEFGHEKTSNRIRAMLQSKSSRPIGIKKDLVVQRNFLKKARSWEIFSKLRELYELYAS